MDTQMGGWMHKGHFKDSPSGGPVVNNEFFIMLASSPTTLEAVCCSKLQVSELVYQVSYNKEKFQQKKST